MAKHKKKVKKSTGKPFMWKVSSVVGNRKRCSKRNGKTKIKTKSKSKSKSTKSKSLSIGTIKKSSSSIRQSLGSVIYNYKTTEKIKGHSGATPPYHPAAYPGGIMNGSDNNVYKSVPVSVKLYRWVRQ